MTTAADVIERVAAAESADPASDDLTIPLAIQLAELQNRMARIELISRGNKDHDACRVIHQIAVDALKG